MARLVMLDLDDTLVQRPPLVRAWAQDNVDLDAIEALIEADAGGLVAHEDPDVLELRAGVTDLYRLTPDVRERLAALRAAGWRLAVVTNGPVSTQARKVEVTGLGDLVDAVCISEEVGVPKPDPQIFRAAAERAGTSLEEAWMVGDNLDADIAGGHGVGASTILVRRSDDWLSTSYDGEPDLVVDDVDAALDHLLGNP